MTGRAKRLRRLLAASLTVSMFLLTVGAGAADSGVTVTVQNGYWADYGVTIPFTRSPRTTDYTFSLYEGGSAAGAPVVSAEVEMTAAQGDIYLPLAYDTTGPESYTLRIEARPLASRIGTDTAAAREFPFTTKPTCGCASGTAGAFYRGSGSAADPFYVGTPQQLTHVARHNGSQFLQTQDIDLAGAAWTPIDSENIVYDGNGHLIKRLYVNVNELAGLWTTLTTSTVQNLGIEGSVEGAGGGGLAGVVCASTVRRCFADVKVTSIRDASNCTTGGLIGACSVEGSPVIEDCYALGTVRNEYVPLNAYNGGLIGGDRNTSIIRRCYAANEIFGESVRGTNYRGGVLGIMDTWKYDSNSNPTGGSISSCYWLMGVSYGIGTLYPPFSDSYNAGTQGLNASQMADQSSFSSWDFVNVWRMESEAGRPVLRVFDNPVNS